MTQTTQQIIPLRIGVSACLLGQNVRYDGGHKRDAFVVEQLAEFAEHLAPRTGRLSSEFLGC